MEYKTILLQVDYERVGLLGLEKVQDLGDVDQEIARMQESGWDFLQLSHSVAGPVLSIVAVFKRTVA